MPLYLVLELVFLLLYTLVLWRPDLPTGILHLYFSTQALITLALVAQHPEFDFIVNFYILLSLQAAMVFTDSTRWVWVSLFVVLTGGSLTFYLGVNGLALALLPMVGCILFSSYVVSNQEVRIARRQSESMLRQIKETNRQLELRASQVEELATIEERNRLAREIHDSVSQTMFSIILNIRSTQILLEREPARVRPQLEQLQELSSRALSQMRALISQWRPG